MRRIGVLMPDQPRTIRKHRPASRRSCRGCSNWAGPSAATCGSTIAGPRAMPTRIRRYAAELVALAPDVILASWQLDRAGRCSRRPAPCRSCSRSVTDPVGAGFVDEPGAAGRQRHRLYPSSNTASSGEMAGAAQGDRAGRDASGGPSGSRQPPRDRPVRPRSRPWRRRSGWR